MIARVAKEMGILTVGVVTKPFEWEVAILKAAQDSLPKMLPLARPVACRSDWHSLPMPASRITVPLETCYSPSEMAAIVCGSLSISQDDKWFIFYEDGVLHCHRSATGICLYRVYFQPTATGWQASQVEINRHPGQHTESNDSMNLALLESIMDALRLMRPILVGLSGNKFWGDYPMTSLVGGRLEWLVKTFLLKKSIM